MSAANWFHLEVPAQPENVGFVRVAVAAFASQLDFTLSELEDLKVAVSEAVSNAVLHAYPQDQPGGITVRCRLADGALTVTVADRGRGIADVEQARRTGFSTLPDRMGMGFLFIEAFTDAMHVTSAPGAGTTVTMLKRPAGADAAAGSGADPDAATGDGYPGSGEGGEPVRGARAGRAPAEAARGQVALDFDPGDDGPAAAGS